MDIWYGIFHRILDMSVAGGIAALAVLAIRVLIRRAPKKYAYLLWGIVLFRLLCPVSLPSRFSALNLAGRAAESNGAYVSLQSAPAASSGAGGCLKIGKGNIPLWTAAGGDGKEPVPPGMGDEGDGKEIFQLGNRAGGDGKEPVQSENWAGENGKGLLQPETAAGNMPVQEGAAVLGTPISIAFAIWLAGAGAMACSGRQRVPCGFGKMCTWRIILHPPLCWGWCAQGFICPLALGNRSRSTLSSMSSTIFPGGTIW